MNGPEIVQFSDAVRKAFSPNELETLLKSLNRSSYDYAVVAAPYPDQVVQIVGGANSDGWIAAFVNAVVAARPDNADVQAFLTNNPHWDPATHRAPGHPCDTLFIFGGKTFVGRSDLRKYLKKMNTPTGKKVMVVTSEHRKVGKTYSKELVDYLADHNGTPPPVFVDLDQDDYDPGKLAAEIAKQMRFTGELSKQGNQQAARWNQELVRDLIPLTNDPADTVWWIVLDGFRQRMPSEATQDFIAQLAQRIQGTSRFRLLLVNYTFRLPLAVEAWVFKDQVKPLDRAEVQEFLGKVHEQKHGAPPPVEKLEEYVTEVYNLLDENKQRWPEAADDQELLNKAVSDAADAIQG